MTDTAVRCGYSRCRAELAPPGPQGGRPRSFCRDTHWEGGRTCGQMARAEREALGTLGLDTGSGAFALDADRLREHVAAVAGPVAELSAALAAVGERLDEVQRDALAATEAARTKAAEADAARQDAETARDTALARAREADRNATEARRERTEAVTRAEESALAALEATEALGAARQQATAAESARDRALDDLRRSDDRANTADRDREAAVLAARTAEHQRDTAHREIAETTRARDQAAEELATLRAAHDELRGDRDRLAETAAEQRSRLVAQQEVLDDARGIAEQLRDDYAAVTAAGERARAENRTLAGQLDQACRERDEQAAEVARLRTATTDATAGDAPRRMHPEDLAALTAAMRGEH